MTTKNVIKFVCSVLVLVALIAALAAIAAHREPIQNPTRLSLEEAATALEHGSKTERIEAVQALVARATYPRIECEVGMPLLLGDCGVRIRVVNPFGMLAGAKPLETNDCRCEPQILEYLGAAYARESDSVVKVAIVQSLSEFNTPAAAELIGRALEDSDMTVRTAALNAKSQRQRRLASLDNPHR